MNSVFLEWYWYVLKIEEKGIDMMESSSKKMLDYVNEMDFVWSSHYVILSLILDPDAPFLVKVVKAFVSKEKREKDMRVKWSVKSRNG